jgi:NADH-quinone oxidoreductase subunit C
METIEVIKRFREEFGGEIIELSEVNSRRVSVSIEPGALLPVAEWLYLTLGFRFIIASALHTKRGFEIHYHFSLDLTGLILNLHVVLDKKKPAIASLSNMFSASNWIEREMHELLGIDFINHPNQEMLISQGNWAEGVYPLRKDFN